MKLILVRGNSGILEPIDDYIKNPVRHSSEKLSDGVRSGESPVRVVKKVIGRPESRSSPDGYEWMASEMFKHCSC